MSLRVEDLSLTASGEDEEQAVDTQQQAYLASKRLLTKERVLRVAPQKAHLLATSELLARQAAARLGAPAAA